MPNAELMLLQRCIRNDRSLTLLFLSLILFGFTYFTPSLIHCFLYTPPCSLFPPTSPSLRVPSLYPSHILRCTENNTAHN